MLCNNIDISSIITSEDIFKIYIVAFILHLKQVQLCQSRKYFQYVFSLFYSQMYFNALR